MIDRVRAALEGDARIAYALLFGSTVRGAARPDSDVDVAIGLAAGASFTGRDVAETISRLESATRRPVDLALIGEAPPGLAYRAFAEGHLALLRDRDRLVADKARAVLDYLDFRPVEELCAQGVLAAARGR